MDDEIEQECLRVMRECEEQARGWGLSVAVRSFEGLGIPSNAAVGLYVSRPLPEWCEKLPVCAVDLRAALALSNPPDRLAAWVAHELGHAVVDAFERAVLPEYPEPNPGELKRLLEVPMTPSLMIQCGLPSHCGHEWPFIRALVHVQFRMQAAGVWVCDQWSFPSDYGLASLSLYRDKLASEAELMADLPIVAAMQARAPESFLELWRADIARAAQKNSLGSSRRVDSLCHSSEEPSSAKS